MAELTGKEKDIEASARDSSPDRARRVLILSQLSA
jgi:hypothetical protein